MENDTTQDALTQIPNFPDYYITKNGDVYSTKRKKLKKLKTHTRNGYLRVGFMKDGISTTHSVHRLVLETFVGECPTSMICRHLNGTRDNNQLDNLSWGTYKENMDDKLLHGRYGIKLTELDVIDIRVRYANGERPCDIKKEYNLSGAIVGNIISGKTWLRVTKGKRIPKPKKWLRKAGFRKLTQKDVDEIRLRHKLTGESHYKIAKDYCVNRRNIGRIINYVLWKD